MKKPMNVLGHKTQAIAHKDDIFIMNSLYVLSSKTVQKLIRQSDISESSMFDK